VTSDRKAAIAAYKERKNLRGGFRHPLQGLAPDMGRPDTQSGKDPEPDLVHAAPGSHTCRTLQAAWTAHGPDSLTFEECERLEEEETSYIRDALLKERALHWRSQLNAEAV